MLFRKVDWLRRLCVVTSAWLVVLLTHASSPGADENTASLAVRGEAPATVEMVTADASAKETAEQPAAASEESTATADPVTDEPAVMADTAADKLLEPIPTSENSGTVPVRAASFKGITPGESTTKETQEAWGPPKEVSSQNGQLVHLYEVEPFDRVEVSFADGRASAIVIRLDAAFPAETVAEQLELSEIRPVLVSNELGQVLGQSFPENGVLFAFVPSETPGTASMQVTQVVLEPISAEPFVLRAETNMNDRPDLSRADLEQAIKTDPECARAHWLQSRVLAAAGELETALEAAGRGVELKAEDSQYRLTRAQILGQLGRFAEAIEEAEQGLSGTKRPHVRARALCLLGDLVSSQPQPDYRKAIEYHMEAVKATDPLAVSQHPAIRL
ncbi:MAG: tetratricopeptide repeat protein, partial [Planctomycetes bacterium]|nr:tetratricopeptide repeat protein [Planctomycetota bacterium]